MPTPAPSAFPSSSPVGRTLVLTTALLMSGVILSFGLGPAPSPAAAAGPAGEAEASLDALAWLPGTWRGTAGGQTIEEIWTTPGGGAMAGVFRWYSPDSVRLYELLTIEPEEGSLVMRLRHFSDALEAWEEKDAPLVFRLTGVDARSASFATTEDDGTHTTLVYTHESAAEGETGAAARDRLTVSLRKRPPGGEERRTEFVFERY